MSGLRLEDFPAYFAAVHGAPPFKWQQRLMRDVATSGWPRTIAAPTGAGKTAVLDIALFNLALEAAKATERAAPLRICFAVDRRIVVDQAYERALAIREKLAASQNPYVRGVAEALSALSCGERPLHVEQLRGGMPREDDWARTPTQPTILCTTVDQLGSRLLFRGYGVSEKMAPVHAGLLGEDCLLLLDEAHLSQAFAETLEHVARWRGERECGALARPWRFASLTATPKHDGGDVVFRLSDEEQQEERIRRRLVAEKRCSLVEVGHELASGAHIQTFVDHALKLAHGSPQRVVAVVVNRVELARAIFEKLAAAGEAILLTGRVRPIERDDLIRRYAHRLFAGASSEATAPLFVVATQCVEAGADFDFDALITQIAPLDALRQRFGRLDRLGSKSPTQAVVLAAKNEVGAKADDPIYGVRAKATWDWLMKRATPSEKKGEVPTINFGPVAMQTLIDQHAEAALDCMTESKPAPILRGADLAFLSMTHPRPHPDPELSLILHGELGKEADVSIAWRADIEACFKQGGDTEQLAAILSLAPPRPGEALRIPLWHARAWLKGRDAQPPLADVDTRAAHESDDTSGLRMVARRARDGQPSWEFVDASAIRPGDTLIAPTSYGGCDGFGWAAREERPVADIADRAAEPYEGKRAALRLHPELWPKPSDETGVSWPQVAALVAEHESNPRTLVNALLDLLEDATDAGQAAIRERITRFAAANVVALHYPYGNGESPEAPPPGAVLFAPRGLPGASAEERGEAVTDDGDAGSFLGKAIELSVHRRDVEAKARRFAEAAGLPRRLANSVERAALLHDDGKGDPRFQAYLVGGAARAVLAKSARRLRGEDRAARVASGLPERWRHEALSVRLACQALEGASEDEIDPELVVWLVGTHHGYGRPFFPHDDPWDDHARPVMRPEGGEAELSPAPGPQRLDFEWRGMDWVQLFEALKRRYGVWGLAYLEAIVRLADHRASEDEERGR